MKYSIYFVALFLATIISCDSGRTISVVDSGNESVGSLTFEDTVRFHTEKYCKCSKPLNEFVARTNLETIDSAIYAEYQMLQNSFMQCFDPQGVINDFGQSLDSAKRIRQKELFRKYRQEICPDIIPQN